MFVIHNGKEFVNGEHLRERLSIEQLLGSLLRDGVGQSPVRIVCHYQVPNILHRLLLPRIHLLPAKVSVEKLNQEKTEKGKKI